MTFAQYCCEKGYLARSGKLNSQEYADAWRMNWEILIARGNMRFVRFPPYLLEYADRWAARVVPHKVVESNHEIDCGKEHKRQTTAYLVEQSFRIYYSLPVVNPDDIPVGKSKLFNVPDFLPLGIQLGIKGSMEGAFPLFFTKKHDTKYKLHPYPQVIATVLTDKSGLFLIGIAEPPLYYCRMSDVFVKSPNIEVKSGYYGHEITKPLPPVLDDLKVAYPVTRDWNERS